MRTEPVPFDPAPTYADPLDVVLESISQGVYLLDADRRIVLYNNRLCELLDVPHAFFDACPTLAELNEYQMQRGDFGPDTNLVDPVSQLGPLDHADTPAAPHFLRQTNAGRTLEVLSTLLPDGSLVRTFADVTSYIQEQAARKKANDLLEATQAIAMVGGWEINLQTQELSWSPQVYQIFDTTPEDFTPTPASTAAMFTPAGADIVAASYEGHHEGLVEHDFELEMITRTGRHIWVHSRGTTLWERGRPVKRTAIMQDITTRKQSEAMIWEQAHFDALTGLPNRRMLRDRLSQELKKCRRDGFQLALLMIDLDHFKEVNDTLGHDRGDDLLKQVSQRILHCMRETDTVARMGGDEFTVVVTELHDPMNLQSILPKLLQALSSVFQLGHDQVFVSASIGVTVYPNDGLEIETLLRNADQAMYVAKGGGRNRFSFFTPALQEAALLRAQLTHDLRAALVAQQFRVVYQPIIDLATGEIRKAEALVRWQHPSRGLISPAEFIPVAESSGLIVDLGEWVFTQALAQVKAWRSRLHPQFQISVNKSPVQFENPNPKFAPWIEQLRANGLGGDSVAVEITEGLLLSTSEGVVQQLLSLRDQGIQVSLDDFGTGYSSLSYLQRFDIDYVKIDQSFVRGLVAGSTDLALCQAIIVMAHALGMRVVAEGVETQQQADLLMAAGCDFAQGYLYSRPISAADFEALVDARQIKA